MDKWANKTNTVGGFIRLIEMLSYVGITGTVNKRITSYFWNRKQVTETTCLCIPNMRTLKCAAAGIKSRMHRVLSWDPYFTLFIYVNPFPKLLPERIDCIISSDDTFVLPYTDNVDLLQNYSFQLTDQQIYRMQIKEKKLKYHIQP